MTDRQYLYQKYKKHRERLQKQRKLATSLGKEVLEAEIALLDLIIADLNWLQLEKV